MSQSYGPADDAESIATIHRASTSASPFSTPRHVRALRERGTGGQGIASRRAEVVLATKFGNERRADGPSSV